MQENRGRCNMNFQLSQHGLHHAPGYFLTTRRDPRGQKMKPKEKATPSSLRKWKGARKERVPTISKSDGLFPKLEHCLEGEAADYFQS